MWAQRATGTGCRCRIRRGHFEMPNRGASCRSVRLVRQYAATRSTRSSSGSDQGCPGRVRSAPSRRGLVISSRKSRGLNPVNGAIQDGSDAVITPPTPRSSHRERLGRKAWRYSLICPVSHHSRYLARLGATQVRLSSSWFQTKTSGRSILDRSANRSPFPASAKKSSGPNGM